MWEKFFKEISMVSIGVFILNAVGFFIWNVYLSFFGASEYNFLQTRFLLTGIVAVLFLSFPLFIGYVMYCFLREMIMKIDKIQRQKVKITKIKIYFFSLFFSLFLGLYIMVIFPLIPQSFGGAKPTVASLLGSPDQMKFVENFNLTLSANSNGKEPVQTQSVCILYQNNDHILIGIQYKRANPNSTSTMIVFERNLYIRSDQIIGLQFMPGDSTRCVASDYYIYKLRDFDPSADGISKLKTFGSCEGIK
jgi:hypothetical protein